MKKSMRSTFCLMLSLLALISLFTSQGFAAGNPDSVEQVVDSDANIIDASSTETHKPAKRLKEIKEKRTSNTKVFQMDDGTMQAEISLSDVHYETNLGTFEEIDTSLIDEADIDQATVPLSKDSEEEVNTLKSTLKKEDKGKDNTDTDFRALQVPFNIKLPKKFKKGYSIGKADERLSFIPLGANNSKGEVVGGNSITYSEAWNNTDVNLELQPNGIKESIVLKDSSAPTKFTFEVSGLVGENLTTQHFQILPAWLEDAKGNKRDVQQSVHIEGSSTFIELEADTTDLQYPIVIDPTVNVLSASQDVSVYTSTGWSNSNNDQQLSVGYSNDYSTTFYTFVQFNLSSIPVDATIQSANLTLTNSTIYYGLNANVEAYNVIAPWSETTMQWATQPGVNQLISTTKLRSDASYGITQDFNITSAVINWRNGTWSNYGIRLGGFFNSRIFYYNREYAPGAPKLTITYEQKPVAPRITSPNGGETIDTLHNITWNAAYDPDTVQSQLKYQLQLSQDGGTTWSDLVALTAAGSTQYSYNFTNAPASTTYLVRVRAFDGTTYGPWDQSDAPFTIKHNQIPGVPSNISPGGSTAGAATLVAGTGLSLGWNFNDPDAGDYQTAYRVGIYQTSGSILSDTNWVTSTLQSYTVPAGTIARGSTYYWNAQTKDSRGAASAISINKYIKINQLPQVNITSYANNQTVPDNQLTLAWTYSDADGQAQTSYQVLGSQDNWATVSYNSAIISGTASSLTTPPLASGNWSFKVLVNDGLEWSNAARRDNLSLPNAFEPNDTNAQAFPVNYNQIYNSLIGMNTDVDFYKYTAAATGVDRVTLTVPTGQNYDIYVYDSSMNLIASSIRGTGIAENVLFDVNGGSVYYIKIFGVGGNFSLTQSYSFLLSPLTSQYQTTYQYDSNGNITGKTTTRTN